MFFSGSVKMKLALLVLAQFFATSLWFAGNAVYPDLEAASSYAFQLTSSLTIAVQSGFILGTLFYAVFAIADRFSPAKVFGLSALLAALMNLIMLLEVPFLGLFLSRLAVGFFLAGIYPIGMKIAADWADKGLGKSLGFLVGALVLGTAFPHLLKVLSADFPWQLVIMVTSVIAVLAGITVSFLVGDGPHRAPMTRFEFGAIAQLYANKRLRRAAFGYFGHMWELYAFWAFLPVILTGFGVFSELEVSFIAFLMIAIGSIGCITGGILSGVIGSRRVAFCSLLISCICALLSSWVYGLPTIVFLGFLGIWGFFIIPDSPQFSALVANASDPKMKGSALTIVNCIGFSITIVSIQLLEWMETLGNIRFSLLALGPFLGLIAFRKK